MIPLQWVWHSDVGCPGNQSAKQPRPCQSLLTLTQWCFGLQLCLCFLQEGTLSLIGAAVPWQTQDCSAEVEIAAIWSNSPSNFDMYEDDSYSSSSPQDPGTLFEASLYQPTGILLHLSTCAGTRVWCGPCSTEGSLKGGRDFLPSSWCTIFMSRICS